MTIGDLKPGMEVFRIDFMECSEGWCTEVPIKDRISQIEQNENGKTTIRFNRGSTIYDTDSNMSIESHSIYMTKEELWKEYSEEYL